MSIVDELKKWIIAFGGSVAGVQTIADAIRVLAVITVPTVVPGGADQGDLVPNPPWEQGGEAS